MRRTTWGQFYILYKLYKVPQYRIIGRGWSTPTEGALLSLPFTLYADEIEMFPL
jgi:hypothetical protein